MSGIDEVIEELGGIIAAVNELEAGEDDDGDWEDTTREERHWAGVARGLALTLLNTLEQVDDGS